MVQHFTVLSPATVLSSSSSLSAADATEVWAVAESIPLLAESPSGMDASTRGAFVLWGREGSKDDADAAAVLFGEGAGKAAAAGAAATAAAGTALTILFGYVSGDHIHPKIQMNYFAWLGQHLIRINAS